MRGFTVKLFSVATIIAITLTVTACGQKGPLKAPDSDIEASKQEVQSNKEKADTE